MAELLMEAAAATTQLDPLLMPFVRAVDEAAVRAHLEELLLLVTPSIKKIVSRADSPEDDFQESSQQIIKALWQCKNDPDAHAIGNFQHYVTVVASHIVRRRWRIKNPAYQSLRESLRHTLRQDARFDLWEASGGGWLCGLANHRQQTIANSLRLTQLIQQPLAFDEAILPGRDAQRTPQADLVAAIFDWLGHAVGFDQLIAIVFVLRRFQEPTLIVDEDDEDARPLSEQLSDVAPLPEEESKWRQFLEKLWAEIEQLPPFQRIAFLLNFTAGEGALEIFWLYGVASVRRIGVAVQLSDEQFLRVWNDPALDEAVKKQAVKLNSYDEKFALLWRYLPLSDLTIARLIGTERQKVINLRKSAGDRLARRLVAFRNMAKT